VAAFEKAWQKGPPPAIDEYLASLQDGRLVVLVELVHADLECRLKAGEAARIEPYLARFPELAEENAVVLDLIAAEYRLRQRGETDLTAAEYLQRFPQHAPALEERLRPVPVAAGVPGLPRVAPPALPADDSNATHDTISPASPVPPAARADWPHVPGYEIKAELGRGGMGVVYQARQLPLNRLVALKMILAGDHASPSELVRFRAESQVLARLQHPNIVPIYEVGEAAGRPYFSLEFVDGGSLARKLDGTPWPPEKAARLVETLARATHLAHQRGIIHRDLKPANVLLSPEGTPKITDFGLAKDLARPVPTAGGGEGWGRSLAPSALTQTGAVLGTPSYMAPEQAAGKGRQIGPAVDVYALGAILYELLTGRPPFKAETPMDTLMQVLSEEPVPPSRLQPRLPRDLGTICLKCLQKDPRRRYPGAEELAADLHRFQTGEPILARPVGWWERGKKWAKRRPALAALVAVSAVALVSLIAGGWWYQKRLHGAVERAAEEKDRAEKARAREKIQRQRAEGQLVRFHVNEGLRFLEEGDYAGSLPCFVEALKLEQGGPRARRNHRLRLAGVLRQCPPIIRLWSHKQPVTSAAFSPEGRSLVTASEDGTARLWDVSTGKQLTPPLRHATKVLQAAFSPGGRRLVTASAGAARLWDTATGKLLWSLPHRGRVLQASFSRDGRRLVTAGADRTARIWDTKTGKEIAPSLKHRKGVRKASFSPDGRHVVTASLDRTARVWEAKTGKCLSVLKHKDKVWDAEFSPDGRRIVTASDDKTARVWDARTGQPLQTLREHKDEVTHAAFSPDGRYLVTAGQDSWAQVHDADSGRPTGSPLVHHHVVNLAAFSPDGRRVLTASEDQTARVWDAGTGEPLTPPLEHLNGVRFAAFSPDGRLVVTASQDRLVRLWDISRCRSFDVQVRHHNEVNWASFSPDGKLLVTAGDDATARLWDAVNGQPVTPPLPHGSRVLRAVFSPNGKFLATTSEDRTARVWRVKTGRACTPPLKHQGEIWALSFSPDSRLLVTGGEDQVAQVWQAATGRCVTKPLRHPKISNSRRGGPFRRPPGGRGSRSRSGPRHPGWHPRLMDLGVLIPVSQKKPRSSGAPPAPPDRGDRVSPSFRGEDQPPPAMRRQPRLKPRQGILTVAFSPQGDRVATGSSDQTVRVWSVATGKALLAPVNHKRPVVRVAFSHDGRRLLTAGGDRARVWNARTAKPVGPPLVHGGEVYWAAFSPDGRAVVTAGADRTVRVCDWTTGRPLTPPFRHDRPVFRSEFSSDGRRVLTVCTSHARVWDAVSGEALTPPLGHYFKVRTDAIESVSAPEPKNEDGDDDGDDGERDNIGGDEEWGGVPGSAELTYGCFSPEGGRVVTACRDGTARVWKVTFDDRPLGDLQLQAVLLSGRRIDPRGGFAPLEVPALDAAYRELRSKYPTAFTASAKQRLAWHHREAADAEDRRQWYAATWHLTRLIKKRPHGAALLNRRARAAERLGQWRQVVGDCTRSLALEDGNPDVSFCRGRAWAQLGRGRLALTDYTRALRQTPTDGALWLSLHILHAKMGRWKEANAAYQKALHYAPSGSGPLGSTGNWSEPGGNWEVVADDLMAGSNAGLSDWWIWRARGLAQTSLGHWRTAATHLFNCIRLGAATDQVWYHYALVQLAADNLRGYRRVCKTLQAGRARPAAPGAGDPSLAMAWLFSLGTGGAEDLVRVVKLARKAVATRPGSFADFQVLGATLFRAGKLAEAVKYLKKAAAMRKEAPAVWLFLALAHYRQDRAREADRWLEKATHWLDQKPHQLLAAAGLYSPSSLPGLELKVLRREAERMRADKEDEEMEEGET
jgi:WD40 repeat protein/tetratricopeptide (TPR) repeat protein